MKTNRCLMVGMIVLLFAGAVQADFKYTQRTQVTGGALVSMTKTLGVFSKNARQINEPQTTTHMLKGNRMRTEQATGDVQIIDLDGKRFIHIDPAKKTYVVTTFEQFRQQMEQAQARAKAEQAKQAALHPNAQNPNVTMTPHFDAQATGATRTVAGVTANEMKVKLEMEMQPTDPEQQAKMQGQSVSMWVTSDEWMAPSVPGYEQVQQFYVKMSKELDWLPGEMGSMIGASNIQMKSAMDEFRKHSATLKGMPVLTYTSMGMGAMGGAQTQAAAAQAQAQPSQGDSSVPTNPRDAIMKGLGGMFKKKQQQQAADSSTNTPASGTPPPAPSNSMMDTTTEVTLFSSDSLDASLFDVPAGYTQVQPDPNHPVGW